jgi:hypothetical protein
VFTAAVLLACGGLFGEDEPASPEDGTATGEAASAGEVPEDYEGPVPVDQTIAGRTAAVEVCTLEGVQFQGTGTTSVFKSVAIDGERLLVATAAGALHALKISHDAGCVLSPDLEFGEDGVMTFERDVEWVAAANGTIVASNGIFESYVIRGNHLAYTCEGDGYIELADTGTWGIAPWVSSTVERISFGKEACTTEEWSLRDLGQPETRQGNFTSVNASTIVGSTVFIGGSLTASADPTEQRVIGVFTAEGKEIRRFGGSSELSSPEKFGWVHAINGCTPGICVVDSNFRRLTLWDESGTFQGEIELGELFGLEYPWVNDFALGTDGAAYFLAASEVGDDLAYGFIYRVTGLAEGSAKRSNVATAKLAEMLQEHRASKPRFGRKPGRTPETRESLESKIDARKEEHNSTPTSKSKGKGKSKSKGKGKGKGKGKRNKR